MNREDQELFAAIDAGETGVVEQALAAGADANARNGYRDPALCVAASYPLRHGNDEIIACLLAAGADPDAVSGAGYSAESFLQSGLRYAEGRAGEEESKQAVERSLRLLRRRRRKREAA